jgi:iron(III) transport system permease protein
VSLARAADPLAPAAARRLIGLLSPESLICTLAVLVLLWLIVYPLALLLLGSFRTALPMQPGSFTLANYAALIANEENRRAILHTLVSSGLATLLALTIGSGLAWITSRTDMPGRRVFDSLFILPFYLSPFIGALAWTLLGNPRIGFLNTLFTDYLGFAEPPFNIYSLPGFVFVMALYYAPVAYLFVAGALRAMDPALEEAARIHGADGRRTARRITLPLVAPALSSAALLVYLNSAGDFGIPAVIGIPMNYHVITTRIWVGLGYFPPRYTEAAAFSAVLWGLSALIVFWQRRHLAGKSFATVTGRGYRPALLALGFLKPVMLAISALYVLLSILLPYGALAYTSIHPYLSFAWDPHLWTLRNYGEVLFTNPLTIRATRNSFILASGGATLTMLLALVIGYVVMRTRLRARALIDYLSLLPIGVPAVVFGVALLWGYIFLPLPIYGTLWMLLIAYIAHYIPFGVRATASGFAQLSGELEESARVHGASWIGTMRRILVPLLKPALMAGWILLFIEFLRSLSLSILLYSNQSVVMPVVIFELFETGAYPALSAFALVQTALMMLAIAAARALGRTDRFLGLGA